jgi:2-oxoisovalerate dehydrogenase E1 component beta subunit
MPEVTLVEAVNLALARAMEDDPGVVVLGEDVGINGGVFRATVGLQERFGSERVLDTPLAELLISGLCVGMAAQGLRPVGETRVATAIRVLGQFDCGRIAGLNRDAIGSYSKGV